MARTKSTKSTKSTEPADVEPADVEAPSLPGDAAADAGRAGGPPSDSQRARREAAGVCASCGVHRRYADSDRCRHCLVAEAKAKRAK